MERGLLWWRRRDSEVAILGFVMPLMFRTAVGTREGTTPPSELCGQAAGQAESEEEWVSGLSEGRWCSAIVATLANALRRGRRYSTCNRRFVQFVQKSRV